MSGGKKFIWALLAAVMILGSLAAAVFLWGHVQAARAELEREKTRLVQAEAEAGQLEDARKEKDKARERYRAAAAPFSGELRGGKPITSLGRLISGLELVELVPEKVNSPEGLETMAVKVKIRGDYPAILKFLRGVEELPRAVEVNEVAISCPEEEGGNPKFQADVKLTFYALK